MGQTPGVPWRAAVPAEVALGGDSDFALRRFLMRLGPADLPLIEARTSRAATWNKSVILRSRGVDLDREIYYESSCFLRLLLIRDQFKLRSNDGGSYFGVCEKWMGGG